MYTPMTMNDLFFDAAFNPYYTVRPVRRQAVCGRPAQSRQYLKSMIRTDVKESDEGYVLSMELPGFKREEIKAEVKNGILTVSAAHAERSEKEEQKEERILCSERFRGNVKRSFYIGEDITREEIKAVYKDGVLELRIPKKKPEKKDIRIA